MDELDFTKDIGRAWRMFDDLGLGRSAIWMKSLSTDEEFRRAALLPETSYPEIYRVGLSRSAYNFLLRDYSYFQFSFQDKDTWRLAYMPNPWIAGSADAQRQVDQWEALEAMGDLTYEDASDLIAELPLYSANPPIRFDYARLSYKEVIHPAAHFHVGRNPNNRWPTAVLLGPLTFSMFVASRYYPDPWIEHSSFGSGTKEKCLDLRFIGNLEKAQAVPSFTTTERKLLHMGMNLGAGTSGNGVRPKRRKKRR